MNLCGFCFLSEKSRFINALVHKVLHVYSETRVFADVDAVWALKNELWCWSYLLWISLSYNYSIIGPFLRIEVHYSIKVKACQFDALPFREFPWYSAVLILPLRLPKVHACDFAARSNHLQVCDDRYKNGCKCSTHRFLEENFPIVNCFWCFFIYSCLPVTWQLILNIKPLYSTVDKFFRFYDKFTQG